MAPFLMSAIILALCVCVAYTLADAQLDALCEDPQSQTCESCIRAHPKCTWCLKTRKENDSVKRCRSTDQRNRSSDCAEKWTENPTSATILLKDVELSKNGTLQELAVQLKPQKIHLKLRKGEPQKFNVTFRKVSDYPVDLYYVMDLSNSMKDDLDTLKKLGTNLADDIRKYVTQDIQLGFGTFVDKVLMPFASTVPAQLQNPCFKDKDGGTCAPPFGFRHQQSISANLAAFKDAVANTQISGNIDSPEGGLDALMQIAVCTKEIGWRDNVTRLVVFTTDASFHMALDGKLAAILDANDLGCHLKRGANPYLPGDMVYSKSSRQDYPSVGQLKRVFHDNKILPIFAVTRPVKPVYDGLEELIPNSHVDELAADSRNIIDIIKEAYRKLRDTLDMTLSGQPKEVEVKSRVLCPDENWKDNSLTCANLSIGSEIVYEFEITATDCPKETNAHLVTLTSSSLQESVEITLDFLCNCNCTGFPQLNSSQCNGNGSLVCGVCQCNDKHEGAKCQCVRETKNVTLTDKCKQHGLEDDVCANNGQCECGECKCDESYFGKYCQCTDKGCPSDKNQDMCGGPQRGACNNCNNDQKCECVNNYTINPNLEVCTCNDKECINPVNNNSLECSGHGKCNCNECVCDHNGVYWGEKYCQTCIHPNCKGGVEQTCDSSRYVECVLCASKVHMRTSDNTKVKKECNIKCGGGGRLKMVKKIPDCSYCEQEKQCGDICADLETNVSLPKGCATALPQSDCDVYFEVVWFKDKNDFGVLVKEYNKDTDCRGPPNLIPIILPIIIGIFFLGLLALAIWKVYQTMRDKKEWENFENERRQSKWTKGQNPIFKKPSTNCKNPIYQGF